MTKFTHPLDRPVWNSLTTRQADLSVGDGRARRFRPAINLFGAMADGSPASLAALAGLLPAIGSLGLVEAEPCSTVQDTVVHSARAVHQMVLTRLNRDDANVAIVSLGLKDVPEMLALTGLTAPGPFFAETYLLGGYLGVRLEGRLVAMAGQRMKPPGFIEVSAVCTHPNFRGRGLARALMEAVIAPILSEGEAAFLHTYPDNPAVRLYEALGFRYRATMIYTVLERAPRSNEEGRGNVNIPRPSELSRPKS